MKKIIFILLFLPIYTIGYCQNIDTAKVRVANTKPENPASDNHQQQKNEILQPQIYRDTRLGSSTSQYDTYKKNDYGAGAVTTSPKSSTATFNPANNTTPVSTKGNTPIYRDTRLGSSSPLYNTYEKNDYGAGAVTTNPNKWGGGIPSTPLPEYSMPDTTISAHHSGSRNMTKR